MTAPLGFPVVMTMADPPRAAWFHCFSGIAGDMALGSLIDAGADIDEVRSLIERLPVPGWSLAAAAVQRNGIGAVKAQVSTNETGVVRTAAHITALLVEARLPERLRQRALAVFDALAAAEGRVHRKPPEKVHFHEVGGLDAIVDVVGTCAALEVLDVDQVYSSAVTQGIGTIRAAHGMLPNPPPAVVELLRDALTTSVDIDAELTTPTGAAIVAALASGWGPMPTMRIEASGFGAGDRELAERPNLVQVVLGELDTALPAGQPVVLLETNVDDITGEVVADTIAALLSAGAHDAWVTPILMKKGRPAYTVSALADVALSAQVADVLVDQTGTLGVRGQTFERWPQRRDYEAVEVDGRRVRVKVSAGRVKVEHDDASRVAQHTGRPVREVISLAEQAWRRRAADRSDDDPEPPRLVPA